MVLPEDSLWLTSRWSFGSVQLKLPRSCKWLNAVGVTLKSDLPSCLPANMSSGEQDRSILNTRRRGACLASSGAKKWFSDAWLQLTTEPYCNQEASALPHKIQRVLQPCLLAPSNKTSKGRKDLSNARVRERIASSLPALEFTRSSLYGGLHRNTDGGLLCHSGVQS